MYEHSIKNKGPTPHQQQLKLHIIYTRAQSFLRTIKTNQMRGSRINKPAYNTHMHEHCKYGTNKNRPGCLHGIQSSSTPITYNTVNNITELRELVMNHPHA